MLEKKKKLHSVLLFAPFSNNAFCCKNYETAASDFDQKILKYYLDFEGAVYACVFQEQFRLSTLKEQFTLTILKEQFTLEILKEQFKLAILKEQFTLAILKEHLTLAFFNVFNVKLHTKIDRENIAAPKRLQTLSLSI